MFLYMENLFSFPDPIGFAVHVPEWQLTPSVEKTTSPLWAVNAGGLAGPRACADRATAL